LSDLDNTLISYAYDEPNESMTTFINELKEIGFTVLIISNSPSSRVIPFLTSLDVDGVALARKPLKKYMMKKVKQVNNPIEEMVFLGDQFMTDVLVGNRIGLDTYLVDAIERKSEKWYTRINRRLERMVLKKIKRKYTGEYNQVLKEVGVKYGL
jgi:HAD superfamily phosphatase (TIGR01668 family)